MINPRLKVYELKAGDVITMPHRTEDRELQRWLIVDTTGSLLRVIILFDVLGHHKWIGRLMTFSKAEIGPQRWRKLDPAHC
jgi:hypothetical protein